MDNLTKSYVYFFYQGLRVFYPTTVLGDKEGAKQTVPEVWEGWKRNEFAQYILSETGKGDIEEAAKVVFGWKEYVDTGKAVPTMPPLERIQEAAELQEKIDKETNSFQKEQLKKQELLKSQRAYEDLVSNAQKAKEALKKEIHLEPQEKIEEVPLSTQDQEALAVLTQAAVTSPEKFVEEVSTEIVDRIPDEIKSSLTKEQLDQATKTAAANLLERLATQENVAIDEAALLAPLADPKNLEGYITDTQLRQSFSLAAKNLLEAKTASLEQTKTLLTIAINKNVVEHLFARGKQPSFQVVSTPTRFSIPVNTAKVLEDADFLKTSSALSKSNPGGFDALVQKQRAEFFQRLKSLGVFSEVSQTAISGRPQTDSFFVDRQVGVSTFLQNFHPAESFRPVVSLGFGRLKSWAQTKVVSQIGKSALGKALSGAVKKGVGAVATKVSGAKIGAALGTFFGPGVGNVIGAAVGWLATEVAGKLLSRIGTWIKENKWVLFLPLVPIGLLFGMPLLALGGLAGASLLYAGGATPLVGSIGGALRTFFSYLVFPSIITPILLTIIVVPITTALLLFIINSGAYIVPNKAQQLPGTIESPFIGIEKAVVPEKLDNLTQNTSVTYRVRIFAKKGTLTNIHIANEYKVVSASSPANPNPQVPEISNPPATISPAEDYEFEYQIQVGPSYNDSLISDSITVTADAPEQSAATARGSAALTIGDPPISCPFPDGRAFYFSYTPGNETTGHGSGAYWGDVGGSCSYGLPQNTCYGPNQESARNNPCYGAVTNKYGRPTCDFYGYALDVYPGSSNDVFAPTVEGKSVVWAYSSGFTNPGNGGYTRVYTSGPYTLILTHIDSNASTSSNITSGEKIGRLYPAMNHIHIEFSVGGEYKRPEDYFCF